MFESTCFSSQHFCSIVLKVLQKLQSTEDAISYNCMYTYIYIYVYIYIYSGNWNASPNWKVPKTTWREVPYFHVGNSLSGWYQGHSCVGHGTSSIIPLSISAMIARNMCSKRYCIPSCSKKQLRFSQLKSSNSYQIGMLKCASLPVTCSLLIARDLEANDLSKPAPVTGQEIYRNPGVKKKQPDWISTELVLVSIHPKLNGTILSVGPIGDFLDSILFFTTSW